MLAIFCLRLGFGLVGSLWLFPSTLVNPRFFRAHFLILTGLAAGAAFLLRHEATIWMWIALMALVLTGYFGWVAWSLEGAPGGKVAIVLGSLIAGASLALAAWAGSVGMSALEVLADNFTSSALLGAATTAMLMGHSYLMAPAMSLQPLRRLLVAVLVALGLRATVAAFQLYSWTVHDSLINLDTDTQLWLPFRWLIGLVAPVGLVLMAWQAAKIRSTQSATGILYVVVIFCFLGELTNQLLLSSSPLGMQS
jgi:hypothetical protein